MSSSRERERLARQKKQQRRRRRQIMVIVVELVLLILVGACCYVVSAFNTMQEDKGDKNQIYVPSFGTVADNNNEEDETKESQVEGETSASDEQEEETKKPNKGSSVNYNTVLEKYWNIVLLGLDYRPTTGEKPRSDVMIICSINRETHQIKLVSVYRDTYMKIADASNNYGYNKANDAYFVGDEYTTINMLNLNLDMTITDYVTVDWEVVAKCINLLGGIELELTEELIHDAKFNSFVTETVENTGIGSFQIWEPGTYVLDGVQTVAYCRLRKSDSDFHRTERQRQVIEKALQKVTDEAKAGNVALLLKIFKELEGHVRFSIKTSDILQMIYNAGEYEIVGQTGYPFTNVSDKYIGKINNVTYPVVPVTVESNVRQLHEYLFGEEGYEPTSALKEISNYIKKISGKG